MTATGGLFAHLVDDAGLFPPAELPMAEALRRHAADEGNPVVTGRFLCPASRLAECLAAMPSGPALRLALICDLAPPALAATVRAVRDAPRLDLRSIEGVLPDPLALSAAPAGPSTVPLYAEVRCDLDRLESVLDVLAGAGHRGKVRCGGQRGDLFPTPDALARFIRGCAEREVAFKATAGLHHAVAHRDPATGFDHHGFLNLVVAAARATSGGDAAEIAEILRVTDPAPLVAKANGLDPDAVAAARALFACYGSCSTSEPWEDLIALGLVPAPAEVS